MNKDYTQITKAELQSILKKKKIAFKKSDRRDDLIARIVVDEAPISDKVESPLLNKIVSFFGIVFVALIITILIKVL